MLEVEARILLAALGVGMYSKCFLGDMHEFNLTDMKGTELEINHRANEGRALPGGRQAGSRAATH